MVSGAFASLIIGLIQLLMRAIFLLIALTFIVIIGWLLIGILRSLFRCPKESLIFGIVLITVCVICYKYFELQNQLRFVPAALNVEKVLYAKEEAYGIGPGGNEGGIVVYELPEEIAKDIQRTGIDYLTTMPNKQRIGSNGWQGLFSKWHHTPILLATDWVDPRVDKKTIPIVSTQNIRNFTNKYISDLSVDKLIEDEVNKAISKSGSYFAYGRIGMLIVIPNDRKVVFAYNG